MTPNHQLVESIGSEGRVLIAVGLLVMVAILATVAFLLGRAERRGGGR